MVVVTNDKIRRLRLSIEFMSMIAMVILPLVVTMMTVMRSEVAFESSQAMHFKDSFIGTSNALLEVHNMNI